MTEPDTSAPAVIPEVIAGPAWSVPKSILITNCLQRDFVGRLMEGASLPNLVHIGRNESERLLGEGGALIPFLSACYASDPADLAIIHVVDMHDPQLHRQHLERFKRHGVCGTEGAELIDVPSAKWYERPNTFIVPSTELNDFESSSILTVLRDLLEGRSLEDVAIGVVGVWTDAKVSYLLYDLSTRLGAQKLATCSTLTASKSVSEHFEALDRLGKMLGVEVFHSTNSFLRWLAPSCIVSSKEPGPAKVTFLEEPRKSEAWTAGRIAECDLLLSHMGTGELQLKPLNGGFSGSLALVAKGDDSTCVIKVGQREEIAGERFGNERIRRVLGDVVPRLIDYREGENLAAMKIELVGGSGADCDSEASLDTFQSLAQRAISGNVEQSWDELLESVLEQVLDRSLGRLYRAGEKDNFDLLEAYSFLDAYGAPRFAKSPVKNAAAIAEAMGFDSVRALLAEDLGSDCPFLDPETFYNSWLPGKTMMREVFASQVHADLNLANILVSCIPREGTLVNNWIIDFARLNRMPVLTDFAKIENDLSYIVWPIESEQAYRRACVIQNWRLHDFVLGISPAIPMNGAENSYMRMIRTLRNIAARIDDRGDEAWEAYRVALMRYSAHTLSFTEPNMSQRRLALAGTSMLGALIAESVS